MASRGSFGFRLFEQLATAGCFFRSNKKMMTCEIQIVEDVSYSSSFRNNESICLLHCSTCAFKIFIVSWSSCFCSSNIFCWLFNKFEICSNCNVLLSSLIFSGDWKKFLSSTLNKCDNNEIRSADNFVISNGSLV